MLDCKARGSRVALGREHGPASPSARSLVQKGNLAYQADQGQGGVSCVLSVATRRESARLRQADLGPEANGRQTVVDDVACLTGLGCVAVGVQLAELHAHRG